VKLSVKIPALIGIIVLVTIIVIILLMENLVSNQVEKAHQDKLNVSVSANVKLINAKLEVELGKLWEVANRARTRSMDWENVVRESLLADVQRLEALELGLVYPDGLVHYVSANTTANLGDRDYIQQALKGKNNVSDVIVSRVTNSLVLMFAAPVVENNDPGARTIGALIERRDGSITLKEFIDQTQTLEGTQAFMINKEGTIVAHNNIDMVLNQINPLTEGKTNPDFASLGDLVAQAVKYKSGTFRYHEKNKSYLVSYQDIPDHQWILIVMLDEAIVKADTIKVRNNIIFIGFICLIIGIIVSIFVGRSIANPIIMVANVVKSVSKGKQGYDLTKKINSHSKDETGELATYFNELLWTLRRPMCEIRNVINSSIMVTKELSSISNQMEIGNNETVAKSNNITDITNAMANNISSVAASSEEVSSSASDVTNTAALMSKSMDSIVSAIDEMDRNIVRIAGNTNKMKLVSEEANTKSDHVNTIMKKLEKTANEIGDVTQTIKSIANKTNLLALNASVEAARAGDTGKGFAVVADEVKALASQSATSADDIERKISDIQREILQASSTFLGVSVIIKDINHNVEEIKGLMENQTKSSNSIATNITETNDGAKSVATAIGEVAKGSHLIAENSNDISRGTIEVSEHMIEMNNTANKGVEGSTIVSDFSQKLKEISSDLKIAIEKFELGCSECENKVCNASVKNLEELISKSKVWIKSSSTTPKKGRKLLN